MGALDGIRVLEIAAIGPLPFCGMMLSDMGADVLRIDRLGDAQNAFPIDPSMDTVGRGRRSAAIDLKNPQGRDTVLALCAKADVILEGYRPGVMERLGLGPDACMARNPKLVYGRATGWGQTGPLAHTAGHDINYLAMAGVLHGIGHKDGRPVPPLNLVGDYGGGGMSPALGASRKPTATGLARIATRRTRRARRPMRPPISSDRCARSVILGLALPTGRRFRNGFRSLALSYSGRGLRQECRRRL